jgi:XTP/dITP diphosphohydrolase
MAGSFVTLWKFRDLPEALLAKGKLESCGLHPILLNDETIRMDWLYSNAIGGIALQVPPEEAEEALELLQEPVPESLDAESSGVSYLQPRCPKCGSLHITHEGLNKLATFGSWLAFGFPIRVKADKWTCEDCQNEWQTQPTTDEGAAQIAPEVMTRIFVATTNPGKVKDFAAMARLLDIDVVPFPQQPSMPEVLEDGETFEANAIKKAEAYSAHLPNELVIADDSGLEVPALGRAPGVHSARFAQSASNPKPSDSDNNYKLIHELSLLPNAERTARFVCVIAAARDGRVMQTFRGEVWGEILPTPIGRGGFGYDPLFFVPQANKTFAEMNVEEKAQYSHRGKAFKLFLDWLQAEISRR